MKLDGKVVIVKGGGTGIGRACALRFAREGARVTIAGLESGPLSEVAKEIESLGGESLSLQRDVGIVEDTKRIITETVGRFRALHILVSNAATVDLLRTVNDMSVQEWDRGHWLYLFTLEAGAMLWRLRGPAATSWRKRYRGRFCKQPRLSDPAHPGRTHANGSIPLRPL